jgi:hypothetical protein
MSVLEAGAARQNGARLQRVIPRRKESLLSRKLLLTAGPLALAPCARDQVRGFDSGQ